MDSTHLHPNPGFNRFVHYGALALAAVMLAAVIVQIIIALTRERSALLMLSALFTLLLIPPVLMLTTATPGITVSRESVTIHPTIWRAQVIPWSAVREIKNYPLLPPHDGEVMRKAMVGRLKYRPAEGKMLVIPDLPPIYRINGFFAGEGLTGVIAVTNRTHTDYDKLVHKLAIYYDEAKA